MFSLLGPSSKLCPGLGVPPDVASSPSLPWNPHLRVNKKKRNILLTFTSRYIEASMGPRSGYYFSGFSILGGVLLMFLINVHKSQLRKRKRSRQRKRRGTSVQSCSTRSGDESTASPRLEEEHEEERRNSFAEEEDEEDLLPALALINSQQALLELIERHSEEGVEGLADLENLPGIMEEALKPKDIQSIMLSSFRAPSVGGVGAA